MMQVKLSYVGILLKLEVVKQKTVNFGTYINMVKPQRHQHSCLLFVVTIAKLVVVEQKVVYTGIHLKEILN